MERARIWLFGIAVVAILVALAPRPARAFGDRGAFDPRILLAGGTTDAAHPSAPVRWSWELVQRTSAPARLKATSVRADEQAIVDEPFLYWSGTAAVNDLTSAEIAGLRKFFALGGILLVDDAGVGNVGEQSAFGRTARQQIAVYCRTARRSPSARRTSSSAASTCCGARKGASRGRRRSTRSCAAAQRRCSSRRTISAARSREARRGVWEMPVIPGGDAQRERAVRLAVNIAMYVLCFELQGRPSPRPVPHAPAALSPPAWTRRNADDPFREQLRSPAVGR